MRHGLGFLRIFLGGRVAGVYRSSKGENTMYGRENMEMRDIVGDIGGSYDI